MWAESVDHILWLLSGPAIILSSPHNCNCLILDSCSLHSAKHWISILELYLVCSLLIKLDSVSKKFLLSIWFIYLFFLLLVKVSHILFWSVLLCHSILKAFHCSFFFTVQCSVEGDIFLTRCSNVVPEPTLTHFVTAELTRGYFLEHNEAKFTERREKVYTCMRIPKELEKVQQCMQFTNVF